MGLGGGGVVVAWGGRWLSILKQMWHPHEAEWWVIWIAVIGGIMFGAGGGGPLVFAGAVLIGALLVWQGGRRKGVGSSPNAIFCGECGERINPGWNHCPAAWPRTLF